MALKEPEGAGRSGSPGTRNDYDALSAPAAIRTWEAARVHVRDDDVRRERSWNEVSTQLTLIVNLGSTIDEFECWLGDGLRSIEPPTTGSIGIVPAGTLFSGALQGQRNKFAMWTMSAEKLACLADQAGIRGRLEIAPRLGHWDDAIHGIVRRLAGFATSQDNLAGLAGEALNWRLALHLVKTYNVRSLSLPARVKGEILSSKTAIALQDHIHGHLGEKVTLDELARIARTSVHNLLLGFRQRFGTTPHQYVLGQRLARARWQLANTRKPLPEIAYDAGFSTQSHMTTVFARHLGTTPSAFRKSAG